MQRRTAKFISTLLILSVGLAVFPYLAEANQPEFPVEVVEGQEPVWLNYGEYTTGARIDDPTDIDRFSFYGSAGDSIRVLVSESGSVSPRLEIWDPNDDKIVDTWAYSDISIDETLTTTGTYLLAISDYNQDYSSDYGVEIQCLLGNCPCSPHLSVDITLNQSTFTTGEELIVEAHLTNGPDPARVEIKLWLENPDGRLRRIPGRQMIFLPPNADITKEVFRRPFTGDEPSGDWNVGGRLLNPISGRELSVDVESLTFSP